jgi:hypothetical protein
LKEQPSKILLVILLAVVAFLLITVSYANIAIGMLPQSGRLEAWEIIGLLAGSAALVGVVVFYIGLRYRRFIPQGETSN